MRRAVYTALACLLACSAADKPEPEEPTDEAQVAYNETVDRLFARFLERGQVVSRWETGEPHHKGDSLLWTGMALGVVPCHRVGPIADALGDNVRANGGYVVRFMPLPDEYRGGREASLDSALGLWWGIANYQKRCGSVPDWFAEHYETVNRSGWVYPDAARVPLDFSYVMDVVAYRAGLRSRPDPLRGLAIGAQVAAWAAATTASKSAAYRIHLGWLSLSAIDATGGDVKDARAMFCTAATGAGMPLINEWCGKGGLHSWLSAFSFNAFEYQLQRAHWESPDGKEGLETPGLDRLVALVTLYNF